MEEHLIHNNREDVIAYMAGWVQLMESQLIEHAKFTDEEVVV